MTRDLRVYWRDTGWVVDTDFGLSAEMLKNICDYTARVQKQRYAGLPPGPVKDECLQTIRELEAGRVSQNIAGTGDRVLFDAYKSDKIIVGV